MFLSAFFEKGEGNLVPLKQKELAELAGYSEKYIKSLELGEAKGTKLSRIIKIAQVLRVKVYKLF